MTFSQLLCARASRHLWVRGVGALVGALAGLCFGGCATHAGSQQVETFVAKAPLPLLVPRAEVRTAAERMAAQHEGDFVLVGVGRSMEPIYHSGTAVVVHPTAMHMLRKGMAVVYTNARGAHVTHMLLERTERGWRAIGLNNADPDGTLVTKDNLVGIIKHAFAADDTPFRSDIAAQLAGRTPLGRGTPIASLH